MKSYKEDFPLLRNSSIAYLDNAATAQRPEAVLKAEREFYEKYNANPLRGLYQLGMDATDCYEKARETVRDFLHAKKSSEIIFTRNTTESINLVAYSYALNNLKEGDELLVGIDSHHSNLLPWQMAARVTGAKLVFLDCEMDGSYTKEAIEKVITERTKFAAITHVSNVIGRVNPVEDIIRLVHKNGGVVLVDAAQSAPHLPIDVCAMDVDFLAFSGHKLMAPMGIGVLYGKEKLLDEMPPFLTGGEMIESVTRESAVFAELPHKFEAGNRERSRSLGLKGGHRVYQLSWFCHPAGVGTGPDHPGHGGAEKDPLCKYYRKPGPEGAQRHRKLYRGGRSSPRYRIDSGRSRRGCAGRPSLRPASFKASGRLCDHPGQHCFLQ